MHFKIFRTHDDTAKLEDELDINISSSTVDEFANFYNDFTSYLGQPDVSIGISDLESATYLSQFRPKKVEITPEMRDDILECHNKGLSLFQISYHLFTKYGVETSKSFIQKELDQLLTEEPQSEIHTDPIPF